jgi:hypothetical protein
MRLLVSPKHFVDDQQEWFQLPILAAFAHSKRGIKDSPP